MEHYSELAEEVNDVVVVKAMLQAMFKVSSEKSFKGMEILLNTEYQELVLTMMESKFSGQPEIRKVRLKRYFQKRDLSEAIKERIKNL